MALAVAIAAGLVACASSPGGVQYASEGVGLTSADGLRRVDTWSFPLAFVKPGVDLTRYDKVAIDGVTIVYKEPPSPVRTSRHGIESGTYLLSPNTAKWFEGHLQKALAIEFAKSEAFSVTQQPTPETIRVTGYILDLVVHVPPDQGVGQASSHFLANRGEFTLVLDLRDALSDAPLLRVADHSLIKFDGAGAHLPSNPATNVMAVRLIFQQAAARLRRHLDEIRALPEIPLAPRVAETAS